MCLFKILQMQKIEQAIPEMAVTLSTPQNLDFLTNIEIYFQTLWHSDDWAWIRRSFLFLNFGPPEGDNRSNIIWSESFIF